MKKGKVLLLVLFSLITLTISACGEIDTTNSINFTVKEEAEKSFSLSDVKEYTDQAYIIINGNKPYFSEEELTDQSYEYYSDLDDLGRCGVTHACIGIDLMPTENRGNIGQVKPTGWQTIKYDCVDGKYLYNRCHLIGYQLTGENANERNLITGTRYLNIEGMLPFENMVADYIKETGNHVLYRVTPIFEGDNLVASGVLMEAQSVEDQGEDIEFCIYAYNVQPGIVIDYATGDSQEKIEQEQKPEIQIEGSETTQGSVSQDMEYILNTSTKKFHYPTCNSAKQMKESSKQAYTGSRDEVIANGYEPCQTCKP